MAKKNDASLIGTLKDIFTGGNSSLRKEIKNNPELANDIKKLKGAYKKVNKDLEDLEKEFSDL